LSWVGPAGADDDEDAPAADEGNEEALSPLAPTTVGAAPGGTRENTDAT
jgi:hypothetical protein